MIVGSTARDVLNPVIDGASHFDSLVLSSHSVVLGSIVVDVEVVLSLFFSSAQSVVVAMLVCCVVEDTIVEMGIKIQTELRSSA